MVIISRFIVFVTLCALVMRLMRVRCDISVNKCAGYLSDGRLSGVKFKLPWSFYQLHNPETAVLLAADRAVSGLRNAYQGQGV